jgi:hypothetical protein
MENTGWAMRLLPSLRHGYEKRIGKGRIYLMGLNLRPSLLIEAAGRPQDGGTNLNKRRPTMPIELSEEDNGALVMVRLTGKLTAKDYDHFTPRVESLVKTHGKIDVLVSMEDFHGWEAGALWEDIKFDAKHFGDIRRLAMVGDKNWESLMATFCRPFTTAKIKYFDQSQKDDALAWVRNVAHA